MAMTIYMTVTGASQGAIKGEVTQTGRDGTIMGYALEHNMEIPRDTHTGLPVGQRIHHPLIITTALGMHSPKLFQSCSTGEQLSVTLDFYRINDKGLEEKYYTVQLTKAIVIDIKEWFPETFLPENKTYHHMQTIAMSYEKIVWTYVPDGIESEDDWKAPKLA